MITQWDLSKLTPPRPTQAQRVSRETAEMALAEFSTEVDFEALCDAIVEIVNARADIDADLLDALSNRLGTMAHMENRK